MKVCLISHGNMVHVLARLRAMVELGWDVHWFQIAAGQYEVPGVTVHRLFDSPKMTLGFIDKVSYLRAAWRARSRLAELEPDVVWPHYISSGGLVAWLTGWPRYCVTIHGSDLLERSRTVWGRMVLRRILARAVLVNPVAEHMSEKLVQLGVPTEKIYAKTHGIPMGEFPFQPGATDDTGVLKIVCTRTFNSPLYDIPTLLRAVANLARDGRECRVLLAATGPLEAEFRRLTAALKIEGMVEFGGGYRREELPAIFSEHDIYVSTSLWDGTSISLLEAMACGILPVVSDIPANRPLIRDGENGFLFAPGDDEQLAERIVAAGQVGGERRRILAGNRKLVEDVGDQEKNLASLMRRVEESLA